MPSPFPGMDPYVEASGVWGDFHTTFLVAIKAKLNAVLPRRFQAKVELFVFINSPRPSKKRRWLEPDSFVIERQRKSAGGVLVAPSAASARITLPRVRKRHKSVVVVDRQANKVVTAIETLSPSNKQAGEDRSAYLAKRREYLGSGVNLVEIDLLRAGKKLPPQGSRPAREDYYVMVCRAWEFPEADLWEFTMRDPLPNIPIPLTQDVADAILPLRQCFDRAYDESCYDSGLDYDQQLAPQPRKADAAWVRQVLALRKGATS
ncbi:MAG TPA: DUF4058 family protein [Gemmataceae bacterium]|nr:DUF4058 family protein [Gemmataceae bacterium]